MSEQFDRGTDLNCPVCGVPPMDEDGFEKDGETEFDGTRFAVLHCWSCEVRFAVGTEEATDA